MNENENKKQIKREFIVIGKYLIKVANIRYILINERKHKITVCLMNNRLLFIKFKEKHLFYDAFETINKTSISPESSEYWFNWRDYLWKQ